ARGDAEHRTAARLQTRDDARPDPNVAGVRLDLTGDDAKERRDAARRKSDDRRVGAFRERQRDVEQAVADRDVFERDVEHAWILRPLALLHLPLLLRTLLLQLIELVAHADPFGVGEHAA